MKKTIRIVALMLVLVMSVCALASCGKKLSGKYEGKLEVLGQSVSVTYDFSGSKVDVTKVTNPIIGDSKTTTIEGEYEIIENADETMDIKFTFETADEEIKSGTFDFEEGEDYIKIAGIKYTLKK
jgi:hypothetical protein